MRGESFPSVLRAHGSTVGPIVGAVVVGIRVLRRVCLDIANHHGAHAVLEQPRRVRRLLRDVVVVVVVVVVRGALAWVRADVGRSQEGTAQG